jgi:hypothetical protein
MTNQQQTTNSPAHPADARPRDARPRCPGCRRRLLPAGAPAPSVAWRGARCPVCLRAVRRLAGVRVPVGCASAAPLRRRVAPFGLPAAARRFRPLPPVSAAAPAAPPPAPSPQLSLFAEVPA